MINKASLSDVIAITSLVILLKLDSNLQFIGQCDLVMWWITSKNNIFSILDQTLFIISRPLVNSNSGWETSAHPLANASENLAGWVESRPGQVEFCTQFCTQLKATVIDDLKQRAGELGDHAVLHDGAQCLNTANVDSMPRRRPVRFTQIDLTLFQNPLEHLDPLSMINGNNIEVNLDVFCDELYTCAKGSLIGKNDQNELPLPSTNDQRWQRIIESHDDKLLWQVSIGSEKCAINRRPALQMKSLNAT